MEDIVEKTKRLGIGSYSIGEIIDHVDMLRQLCDEHFTDGMITRFPGATPECMFCGALLPRGRGFPDHSAVDCPVMKYREILAGPDQGK